MTAAAPTVTPQRHRTGRGQRSAGNLGRTSGGPVLAPSGRRPDTGTLPHAIVYYGHYEHSFHRLHPTQDRYWNKSHPDGEGRSVELPKEDYTIEFGFLETFTKDFVIAKVNAIVLPYPIPFVWQRHGGKGVPVQGATTVDDDAAVALLSDAISFNPELRVVLVPLLRSLGR